MSCTFDAVVAVTLTIAFVPSLLLAHRLGHKHGWNEAVEAMEARLTPRAVPPKETLNS